MKITKILRIIDTRSTAEVDGRIVRLSGTGESCICELCGRNHEIHAIVKIDDGSVANVGVGCAKKSSPVEFKRFDDEKKLSDLRDKRASFLDTLAERFTRYGDEIRFFDPTNSKEFLSADWKRLREYAKKIRVLEESIKQLGE